MTTESVSRSLPRLVTVDRAAASLSLSPSTVYRLIGKGELDAVKVGRATRVRVESIERLVDRGVARAR